MPQASPEERSFCRLLNVIQFLDLRDELRDQPSTCLYTVTCADIFNLRKTIQPISPISQHEMDTVLAPQDSCKLHSSIIVRLLVLYTLVYIVWDYPPTRFCGIISSTAPSTVSTEGRFMCTEFVYEIYRCIYCSYSFRFT